MRYLGPERLITILSCRHSLYALLSKKHAKVMEHIKRAEEQPSDSDEAQTSEHVSY